MSRITDEYWIDLKEKAIQNIKETFKKDDDISISVIQRRCRLGYNAASLAFNQLKEDGLIIKADGVGILGISKYVGE